MKIKIYIVIILAALSAYTFTGCKKVLEETPRTVFTTAYLKTPAGLQSAVYALYSGMRLNFGPQGALIIENSGTDEMTLADQGYGQTQSMYGTYKGILTTDGSILTVWNYSYSHINLANAVIQFATEVDMDAATKTKIVAEAHYLRGLYYFILVQQFGAVPLDLGSGELVFNQTPYQGFNRLPTADLFVKNYKTIISDLLYASQNLPDQRPTKEFRLSKSAALHMLSKAYLFRGYSAAKVSTDFDSSYTVAMSLINNQSKYGVALLQNYNDVHAEGNDYNAEILYSVERIPGDAIDNEVNNPSSDFAGKANMSNNWFNCNYAGTVDVPKGSGNQPLPTRVLQYGRPLRQLCPTAYVYNTAFIDKYYDSRYDGTFRTVWLATTAVSSTGMAVGDTAFVLAPSDWEATLMTGKKYRVIPPANFYEPVNNSGLQIFPNIKKYDDNGRATVNDCSGRPFVVAKLSETYLIAAEAALKAGRPADALPLVQTLRKRAAYRTGLTTTELALRQNQMLKRNTGTAQVPVWTDITVADMTIDFIMDERTRELYGESLRWADLACRHLLVDRVKRYNIAGAANVQSFHELRPIPQTQLDAMNDPDKAKYQNPGY